MQQEDLRRCCLAGSEGSTGVDIPALHVLVIADGDSKLSPSMRALLEDMFPAFTARSFDPSWYDDDDEVGDPLPGSSTAEWRSRSQVRYGRLALRRCAAYHSSTRNTHLQLAIFNRIEPYSRDHVARKSLTARRFSDVLDMKIKSLTRMQSRMSMSNTSLARSHVSDTRPAISTSSLPPITSDPPPRSRGTRSTPTGTMTTRWTTGPT